MALSSQPWTFVPSSLPPAATSSTVPYSDSMMYVPFSTVTYVKPLSVLSLLLAAAPGFASAFASVLVPLAAFALVPSVLPFALLEALEAPGAVFSPAVPLVPEPPSAGVPAATVPPAGALLSGDVLGVPGVVLTLVAGAAVPSLPLPSWVAAAAASFVAPCAAPFAFASPNSGAPLCCALVPAGSLASATASIAAASAPSSA